MEEVQASPDYSSAVRAISRGTLTGNPVAPLLNVDNCPLQNGAFAPARFHRSMGPAVGLQNMPRRHTPPVSDEALNSQADASMMAHSASMCDLIVGTQRKEGGLSSSGNLARAKQRWNMQACPGNASTDKKRRLKISGVLSPQSIGDAGHDSKSPQHQGEARVKVAPLTCVSQVPEVHEEGLLPTSTSPQMQAKKSPQEALRKPSSPPRKGGALGSSSSAGSLVGMPGHRAPDNWSRAQKRPGQLGSAYSSRMRALMAL